MIFAVYQCEVRIFQNPPDPRLVKPIPPRLPPVTHFGVPVPSTVPISKGRGLLPAGPSMGKILRVIFCLK